MFIKPKKERSKHKSHPQHSKQNIPKPHPEYPEYVRTKQMAQSGLDQLSRDYVIEHKKLEFLSWKYVTEHGKEFGYELWWDPCDGWFIYDNEEDVNYTGLMYELYKDCSLMYYAYIQDGLEDGVEVDFYPSGELKSYSIYHKRKNIEIYYGWYENGMIKCYNNGKQLIRFDEEGYMYRKAERK